jgi:hypothetical protein
MRKTTQKKYIYIRYKFFIQNSLKKHSNVA